MASPARRKCFHCYGHGFFRVTIETIFPTLPKSLGHLTASSSSPDFSSCNLGSARNAMSQGFSNRPLIRSMDAGDNGRRRLMAAAVRQADETGAAGRSGGLSGDLIFWATRFLPRPRRSAMRALHRFWQEVAAIADNATSDLLREALLSEWRSEIALLYDARPRHEVTRSLLEPVRQYGLKCDDLLT